VADLPGFGLSLSLPTTNQPKRRPAIQLQLKTLLNAIQHFPDFLPGGRTAPAGRTAASPCPWSADAYGDAGQVLAMSTNGAGI
jgi:hypothetical protein